jgi:hypothetical protein
MKMSFEPLRSFNFTFEIPELDEADTFKLSVESFEWCSEGNIIDLSIRAFDSKSRAPWDRQLIFQDKRELNGKLSLLNTKGDMVKDFYFKNLKYKSHVLQLSYTPDDTQTVKFHFSLTYGKVE